MAAKNVEDDLVDIPEPSADGTISLDVPHRWPRPLRWAAWLAVIAAGVLVGVQLVYAGRALPGVTANGAAISGLDSTAAIKATQEHLADFNQQIITLSAGATTVSVNADKLGVQYDSEAAVKQALAYGHSGSPLRRLAQELRSLLGNHNNFAAFTVDDAKLQSYLALVADPVDAAAASATLNFSGSSVTVNPSSDGTRVNRGYLVMLIENRLAHASADPIEVPVTHVAPLIDTPALQAAQSQAATFVSAPLTLTNGSATTSVPLQDIIGWIKVSRPQPRNFIDTNNVADIYSLPAPVTLTLNEAAIKAYVAGLAKGIDVSPQNAALTIADGKATVFQPSREGKQLDQDATVKAIKAALAKTDTRTVALSVKTSKPEVSEDTLNNLGIKELISEGTSTFPGSIAARINNIKLGAALYNGLLIKPGEEFSFNKYFINVDAAHGWSPGLSIIGNKIEPIYGGGICQVSSTLYRAALLAGLDITARTNHAYAISWYTQPFGVPGVDATVYNPGVDLKFVNDTGSYILIQTVLDVAHSSLKFDFYGTKTKVGRIRGPFFVEGNSDDTKPSTTVFYRDILDLNGNVTATDSVTTHYNSSLDFTHVDTP